ncbi:MAG: hypothetical protein KKG09_02210 [Verrucomicrobia bacterium]|nr:hypothetical protein [Verrucomicrobiota bacterium]MBU4291498.1 hypothetical protein [Verrucomicrobiota bacterium]MBU4428772.1 hypothetical protein [Verrucomicrobiota bacterium]MBU4496808.1 hypothetical protein [Verrucomicrobiota bacterium]MCG2680727.1 hypothetical protein [Kiritimatiellia bacterium]
MPIRQGEGSPRREALDWFKNAGWGVFVHYLSNDEWTSEQWNRNVDRFDVEGLARQLERIGVPYIFITIGQISGHYCSPNATYDAIVGIRPSKCSRRDLVSDLYEPLARRGIKLLVYLPSDAPRLDEEAAQKLEWEDCETRRNKRLVEYQRKWESVIREWSLRWGEKISGWWFDGCYFADEMYRHDDEPNFRSFAAAARAGNDRSLVCFNPGSLPEIICHSEEEDYTAGEIASHRRPIPPCPGRWVERKGHKAQWHVLPCAWFYGAPPKYAHFPIEFCIGYTKHVIENEGVITWEIPISVETGLLPHPIVEQFAAISNAINLPPRTASGLNVT